MSYGEFRRGIAGVSFRADREPTASMRLIERYIARRILLAFGSTLIVLTAMIWATQALQRLDLVTAKRQTVGLFLELTGLAIPFLANLIAPIAFALAVVAVFDSLARDNELTVMAASGSSRRRLLRPVVVSALLLAAVMLVMGFFIAPLGLKQLRIMVTKVHADVIGSVVTPGGFMEIEPGLVVHIEDRRADGTLTGLMLVDNRNPDYSMTYFARTGHVLNAVDHTLLVMTDGTIQRLNRSSNELSVVDYHAYAFDLTDLVPQDVKPIFKPSERTFPELLSPRPTDKYAVEREAVFRVEIHDRIVQPLYPLVFALIAFVFVGDPRTTRQSRMTSIVAVGVTVAVVRFLGFGASTVAVGMPAAIALIYLIPLASGGVALALIVSDRTLTTHEAAGLALARLGTRVRDLWRGRMRRPAHRA